MKNKKKILSLIACLSLLSSCNKTTPSSKSCSITASTPTSTITPSKTVEELNKELFENYANFTTLNDSTLKFTSFKSDIPDNLLNLETIIIPEKVNGTILTQIEHVENGNFRSFKNVKTIKIPSTIDNIIYTGNDQSLASPFMNLPNLENIEVDSENEWYYTSGNCLIERGFKITNGIREETGEFVIVCGWKDVETPEEITNIRNHCFANCLSVNTIKLNSTIKGSNIGTYSFRYLDNLKDVDLNGNTNFYKEGNCLYYINDDVSKTYTLLSAWGDAILPTGFTSLNLNACKAVSSIDLTKCATLTTFGKDAFRNTLLESIHIPASVTSMDSSSLKYMRNLKEVTVDENSIYKVNGNCIYTGGDLYAAWGDVVIPEELSNIAYGLQYSQTITSVKLSNSYNSTLSGNIVFSGINDDRDVKDFFKLVDNENNTKYRVKSNCLVINPDTDNEEVICALPDEEGNIVLPSTAKKLSANLVNYLNYSKGIKSITLNEGLTTIAATSYFNIYNEITKINLPSTLKQISYSNANAFLAYMSKVTELTIGNDGNNENEYFKIEDNCLIKKGKNSSGMDDSSLDAIIFAYKDAVIPERITTLTNYTFYRNDAITSLTLHNKLTSFTSYTFSSITTSSFKTINFKGTISEFKTNVGSTSLYTALKRYSSTTVNFIDESGNIIESHLMSELENLN